MKRTLRNYWHFSKFKSNRL